MNSWILFALLSAVVLAWLTLGEPVSLRLAIGVGLMVFGAVLTIGA